MEPLDPVLAVYTLLEEITLRPRFALRDSLLLNRDLRIGTDSYALQVIPVLERRLGIHPSPDEWSAVATVADLASLAEAHVLRGQLSVSASWQLSTYRMKQPGAAIGFLGPETARSAWDELADRAAALQLMRGR